jgi:CRP-like cAMP-binding protein
MRGRDKSKGDVRGSAPREATLQSRLPSLVWDELIDGGSTRLVAAGDFFYHPGTTPQLAAVLDGLVRVFIQLSGEHPTTVLYARPGQVIGLAPMLSRTEMSGAEAVTDTRLAMLSLASLRGMATRHPQLSWAIAEEIAGWAATAVWALAHGTEPVRVRVARHLLELSRPAPGTTTVVPITHQHLADAVGTSREVVTRALRELRQLGVLATGSGEMVILSRVELARIAAGRRPGG